ncbi:N-acetylmuramoyl-L-alanine amidase [Morganella morganii]|nr:N-acetylmuramoyl-L-alanine amidase [Morganella morganii]
MLYIDDTGIVKSNRIKVKIFSKIEYDRMDKVTGIVVHQTNTPSASHTFNSYTHPKSDGAHFLVNRDGTICQTASLFKTTRHVGLMQSLCIVTKKWLISELPDTPDISPSEIYRHPDIGRKNLTEASTASW